MSKETTGPKANVGADAEVRRQVTQQGSVTSVAGKQSVVVRVDRRVLHGRYLKYISKSSKFMAHDERSECGVGDVVEIVSCRPMSARKRWRVRRVVERAAQQVAAELEA